MILTDSHLHSNFSSDSDSSMEEMILAGIKRGLSALCFTEHYDPEFPDTEDHFDFLLDFDAYEKEFLRLREKYKHKIQLYHGVELGVQPHLKKECQDFYDSYGNLYDFIIHSTHVVDHQDPYYGSYFASFENPKKAILHYFETVMENLLTFDNYDTVGHLDYICRYEPSPQTVFQYKDYQDILDQILDHIILHNKSLEVNTAGWKYGMKDPNPDSQILRRYRELGGNRITLGSDGHKPEHLAYDFDRLDNFLKNLGFNSYFFYIKNNPHKIAIRNSQAIIF